MSGPPITRFAPSPTGPLHLGHAFSAMLSHDLAIAGGGTFLLRVEDIDQSRSRPHWENEIFEDLTWLGLDWPRPVMRQSQRLETYRKALARLTALGLTYPCTCSRRDIRAAASAPQEGAALLGPDGVVYPGICKYADREPKGAALRLHMDRALAMTPDLRFEEEGDISVKTVEVPPARMLEEVGDIVVARRDMGTSYHLSVVLDDAAQGITHVVRGKDLFEATPIHVLLQRLLGLMTPVYHHHRLIRDETGQRLAKRDAAREIAAYRADGATPAEIRAMLGLMSPAP